MARHRRRVIDGFLGEILRGAETRSPAGAIAPQTTSAEIASLRELDYASALRKCLGRQQINELLRIARKKVWPQLNRRGVELIAPNEFPKRWSGLGVDFRTADWAWPEGLALVGLYIKRTKGLLERPLICVNTAHHPLMVGAAFDHEMGHHLITQIFDTRKEPARFLTYTGYADHLHDPEELAADILVALAGYPQDEARRLFAAPNAAGDARRTAKASALDKAYSYVASRYGLDLEANLPIEKKLQCLAALIHYTRLRQAVLEEYGI
ncbi:MAG: hypothetical protein ACREP6_10225 [Candidatus Binataceae bacterium]